MPIQKDLKRVVRARMEKTGESYTAARTQVLKKKQQPAPDYAALSGVSDSAIQKATGRTWPEWVRILDGFDAASKPHGEIADFVFAQGNITGWWSQSVTVGYERIRGLRERGQRRSGMWEANKSRTILAPVEKVFDAFTSAAKRRKWLDAKLKIRKATPPKYVYIDWPDGSSITVGFLPKGTGKTSVAIQHMKVSSKEKAAELKQYWHERLDALGALLVKKGAAARA